MATDIFNYNGSLLTQLEDGVINSSVSSLNLVGKGWKGWGQPTQQNLLWVMQNFAGTTAPVHPVMGQLWYDDSTDVKIVKVWTGTEWKSSNGVVYQDTMPATGSGPGALWYDTVNKQMFAWNGTSWDLIGPLGSKVNEDPINPVMPTNSLIEAIRVRDADVVGVTHQIWRIVVGGVIVAVISKDPVFEPDSTILKNAGFNLIYPGLNFSSTVAGNGFSGNKIIQDLLPDVDNVRSLGSATHKYANIYSYGINSNITFPASTPSKAGAVWTSTPAGQLTNPPQLGAIEFDGSSFTFVNKVGGVPVRQAPIFQQDLTNSRRLYVSSINGDDSQNGSEPAKAKKTIKGALAIAEPGDTIFIESGDYYENNPLIVPARVSLVGDNLRRVILHPIHDQLDIFHVDVGTYFFGMTFRDHRAPAYCVAFECSTAAARVERTFSSPNYQKVTNITPTYSQRGYTVAPRVTIEPPPFGGTQAKATANLVNGGIVDITVTNAGSSYSTGPGQVTATVTGATGSGAVLRVRTNLDGTIAAIDVVNPGSNYTGTLVVTITDTVGGGNSATASATAADGIIGSFTITDMGSGYSYDRVPHVSIQPVTPRLITMSPYVQNCSSITGPFDINGRQITTIPGTWISPTEPGTPFATLDPIAAGSGLRIDGDVLADNTVIRSFVADSFTQINQGGIGHLIINNGYAQFVSCFTTFSSVGYWARSGGFANISNSVVDFGDIGIKAEGYYPGLDGNGYEKGTLSQNYSSTVGSVTLSSGGSGYTPNSSFAVTFPHASATVVATGTAYVDSTGAVNRVAVDNQGSGYTATPTINWSAGTGPGPIVAPVGVVNMAQNSSIIITSNNIPLTSPREPKNSSGVLINGLFHTVISANQYSATQWIIDIYPPLLSGTAGDTASFHYISNLSTGGLALEYVGAGVTYYALPYYGGVPDVTKQVQDGEDPGSPLYPGRVYYVTIDNTGNFKVGKLFAVNFADGSVSINANSFNLTGLSGIGPFKRNGAIVGTNADEISDDPLLTHLANPVYDQTTLPTQNAVRQYLQQMSTDLLPDQTELRNVGSTSKRWNNVWTTKLTNTGNVDTGNVNVSGTVTSANIRSTNTTFTTRLINSGNITTGNITASGTVTSVGVSTDTLNLSNGLSIPGALSAGSIASTGAITQGGNQVLHAGNYTTYTVGKDGTGATGTWNISILGNAATATTAGALNTANNYQMNSLGVGTPASGTAGEIRATNDITAFYSSDQRLKTNVKNITDPIAKVQALNGVEFDWVDSYIQQRGGEDDYFVRQHDVGVIAQEVEAVLPEIVATRSDGIKAVKYDRIVALLIEAIKELKQEIDELKSGK